MNRPESLITYVADRPGHDRRYALDCSKIAQELGWRPLVSLDEGLQQTIDWYLANAEWVSAVRGGDYRDYYAKYYENRASSLQSSDRGQPNRRPPSESDSASTPRLTYRSKETMSTPVQAYPRILHSSTGSAFKRIDTSLPGVCLIQPQVIRDSARFFPGELP